MCFVQIADLTLAYEFLKFEENQIDLLACEHEIQAFPPGFL